MPVYQIQQGDTISSVAGMFGFAQWKTIWDDPANAKLKSLRADAHILFPGDKLFVPEKEEKSDDAPTAKYSVFEVKLEKLKLRLLLKDYLDRPLASMAANVEAGFTPVAKTTGEGKTVSNLRREDREGMLTLPGIFEAPLRIGFLDPVTELSGQIARLNNLGYMAGDPESPEKEALQSAVEEFQCDRDLSVTGQCDAATKAALLAAHGC